MRLRRLLSLLIVLILVSWASAMSQSACTTQPAALKARSQPAKWTKADEKSLLARAQLGDASSQMWLASAYQQARFGKTDFPAALKWFRRSAERGDPDAQNALGQMYEHGEGVAQNCALAARWYRRAAEHVPDLGGAGQARNNLGMLYLDGRGVPKDYMQAYMWFKLSLDANPNLSDAEAHMTRERILAAERSLGRWKAQHAQSNDDAVHLW
jgi:TPR repeat protein